VTASVVLDAAGKLAYREGAAEAGAVGMISCQPCLWRQQRFEPLRGSTMQVLWREACLLTLHTPCQTLASCGW
jgi:hypothetical protein